MTGDLSIVIAVRDGAEWIAGAVESAAEADGLLEIVVVDDGSSDGSGAAAEAAGNAVRVLRQEPRGLAAAQNAGVAASRGSLVAFLDSDDRWVAGNPDPRRAHLTGADGVWARIQCVAAGRPHGAPFHIGALHGLLLRREAIARVGPFDERLRDGHDLDWTLRAQECGLRLVRIDDVVYHYALRPGSMSDFPEGRASRGLLAALARKRRRSEARR